MPALRIAVIGAGLAGLSCARALAARGASVRLLDKGRAAGGRLATRRAEAAGRVLQFDHGAQYLTARTEGFAALLRDCGAAPWGGPGRWVGMPGMSALPRALAAGLDLALERQVTAIEGRPGAWILRHLGAAGLRPGGPRPAEAPAAEGPFDAVAVTLPAVQAAPLVTPHAPAWPARLAAVGMAPCWTVMAAFAERLPLPDALRPEDGGPVGWAARDSSKPGRPAGAECWVIQGSPAWSRTHLEETPEAVPAALLAALGTLAGTGLPPPLHAAAHRWRHSLVEAPLGEACLFDPELRLGLAGDWCLGGRAEAAFESGTALAAALLG
ncbi:NAD(P)/FAD-dependent oxidoreductase [Paracraurococcus lichenis]|uniref:FAD-dependent oxidoreductase n=1 Tax=Paracraurococcus lichenis TaxID=3064888 RepID=A0ABT9DWZ3_9PROT|nr:FAD-dependent oxidoreductase [Paracraurococcus sp. LOR1-02]MDO9708414.1 FAD-dependent oxidoreductase [Paracraurococcus sp. LOR1-02]